MEMDADGLGDLLHQAEQLTANMDSGAELPRVERNLQQILEAGQRLWTRTSTTDQESTGVKAAILLGSKGYDVPKISEKLEGLSAIKTFEPLEPIRDTDIVGFLKNERENALLTAIEDTRRSTFEEVERRHWDNLFDEWEREKQKILQALVGSSQESLDLPADMEGVLGDSISMHRRSALDNVEMAYARQVYIYNDQVIQGGIQPNLVDMFAEVARKLDDDNVMELWKMVQYMTDIPVASVSSARETRTSNAVQRSMIQQAKKYLEQSYAKFIMSTIYGNLRQAQLGGVPGTYHLVRSFLNVRLSPSTPGLENGLVDGHPVWAMIYYCIRCGDLDAAWQVIRSAEKLLDEFPSYFKEYMSSEDHRLGMGSEQRIKLHYRRAIKTCTDPFKRAVYCIVGCCDPSEVHAEVADKTDDYLWIKLCQIRLDDREDEGSSQDRLTLAEFQTQLLEGYGESHFNAYHQPHLYFQVLWLTGQFEAAIEFLSRVDRLRCHAVHVALVLYQLNLLLLPHPQAQLLSKESADPSPLRRLNFSRLVMMYTRKFENTDPREALQYFYFLRDLKTSEGESLFLLCISELVLETREFEMLLGKLDKDGSRKPGAIDKFHGDTQKVIELVARDTENKGLFEDAVMLYDLAKHHDKVLGLMNKLLVQVLSQAPAPKSTKDRLKTVALNIAERYKALGYEGGRANTSTFYLLLDLMTFFDLYHSGSHDQALNVVQQLKLLPFTVESVDQKINSFKHYSDEVRRSLPDTLLATMNILYTKYKNIRNSGSQSPVASRSLGGQDDGGRESFTNYLRSQAKALITFAGMLPYRMPGDTNARLVQMEVLMH